MKAGEIFKKNAVKNMIHWDHQSFKLTHSKLYKTIIDSINEGINTIK